MISSWNRPGTRFLLIGFLATAPLSVISPAGVHAKDENAGSSFDHGRRFVEIGVPSTGLNRNLGEPIWRYPALEPFVPMFGDPVALLGFNTVGALDTLIGPGNGNSTPLSPTTPGDALVASHLDAIGLGFVGLDPSTVPFSVLNVPVDETEILVDEFGVHREAVTCATDSSDLTAITRSGPCDGEITLDTWMRARGVAVIDCHPNGTARARVFLGNLRPNRLYTVWMVVEDFASGPQFLVRPIPFGGVPNVVITDRRGRAQLDRNLSYCPHDQPQALGLAVVMRGNGENFGGVAVPFLNQQDPTTAFDGFAGLIPGSVAFVQLSFNLGGIPLDSHAAGVLDAKLVDDHPALEGLLAPAPRD